MEQDTEHIHTLLLWESHYNTASYPAIEAMEGTLPSERERELRGHDSIDGAGTGR